MYIALGPRRGLQRYHAFPSDTSPPGLDRVFSRRNGGVSFATHQLLVEKLSVSRRGRQLLTGIHRWAAP
jgi:hypothetical protein